MDTLPSYRLLRGPDEVVAHTAPLSLEVRPVEAVLPTREGLVEMGVFYSGERLCSFYCRSPEAPFFSPLFQRPLEVLFRVTEEPRGLRGTLFAILTSDHLPEAPRESWEEEPTHSLEDLLVAQRRKAVALGDVFRHRSERRFPLGLLQEADDFLQSFFRGEEGSLPDGAWEAPRPD